ncbi:Aflatoxin biosynthesis regulatory protein [Apiospora rasikravindrae]|uniref:Aflatoxin biosynthesis regulatory protein n=1 Tax=Apiospora rasikravindrae TaxID=990691 RepID=A0ABR1U8I6_9PEZI
MAMATARPSRPPRLRSSCDSCAILKIKCDQGQPSCSRCASRGIPCVYGMSRRMGKPRRDSKHLERVIVATNCVRDENRAAASHRDQPADVADNAMSHLGTHGGAQKAHSEDRHDFRSEVETTEPSLSSMMPNLDSFDFGTWAFSSDSFQYAPFIEDRYGGTGSTMTHDWPSATSPTAQVPQCTTFSSAQDSVRLSETVSATTPSRQVRDYGIEAYEILGGLMAMSCTHINAPDLTAPGVPTPSSTLSTASAAVDAATLPVMLPATTNYSLQPDSSPGEVALDELLGVCRGATERLCGLLRGACSGITSLVIFLSISSISRIFSLYYKAAAHIMVTASQASGPETTMALPSSTGAGAGFGKIMLGALSVDDLRVQAALKMQLLLGEARRVGRPIDLLASSSSSIINGNASDGRYEPTEAGKDGLSHNLVYWVRAEHERVISSIRSRLNDLSS